MKSKNPSDRRLYCRLRNQAKRYCREALKNYEKNVAKQVKDNPKAFWKYVNTKLKYNEAVAELKTENGTAISDKEKAYEKKNLRQFLLWKTFTPCHLHL